MAAALGSVNLGQQFTGISIIDPVGLNQSIGEHIKTFFYISADNVENILKLHSGLTIDQLLINVVSRVKEMARPLISGYKVGVVGLGKSGNIYGGVNLEFQDLSSTIHAEQVMTVNARNHGETFIEKLALSAAPCGYCRQFLNEIGNNNGNMVENMKCLIPGRLPVTLEQLLPDAFGPGDLGISGGLLSPVKLPTSQDLVERAREAAQASYVPYSECPAGVSIQINDGRVFSGSYLENAAYNPTIPPLQAALVELVENGIAYDQITRVVLAQKKSQKVDLHFPTMAVLSKICPGVKLETVTLIV